MRARIKLTTTSVKETIIGILREHHWWPHFKPESEDAQKIITDVRNSLEEGDISQYDGSDKFVVSHTPTDSYGTFSFEHRVWVVRLLNPNVHSLQLACETLVSQLVVFAVRNDKTIDFVGPIQIVERNRKQTIIEGRALATRKDRIAYAKRHRQIEFRISRWGGWVLLGLILLTFPWPFRDPKNLYEIWTSSVLEKFIGSVAVTTLIAYLQYRSFRDALREHTIQWAIPGEPEKLDVKPHSV
jgi:hypothetical protein